MKCDFDLMKGENTYGNGKCDEDFTKDLQGH